jgi:hypothetical protein
MSLRQTVIWQPNMLETSGVKHARDAKLEPRRNVHPDPVW